VLTAEFEAVETSVTKVLPEEELGILPLRRKERLRTIDDSDAGVIGRTREFVASGLAVAPHPNPLPASRGEGI